MPKKYRTVAKSFQPVMAKVSKDVSALELARILTAVMGEELAAHPKRKTSGLALALMRGAAVREEMKDAEGGSVSAEEAGAALGITKAAALKRYQKGLLLGWREAKQNAVRFPVWQFENGNVLPGLPDVLAVFRDADWMDDWGKVAFFLTPLSSMKGRRPLDLVRDGESRRVVWAAQAAVE